MTDKELDEFLSLGYQLLAKELEDRVIQWEQEHPEESAELEKEIEENFEKFWNQICKILEERGIDITE